MGHYAPKNHPVIKAGDYILKATALIPISFWITKTPNTYHVDVESGDFRGSMFLTQKEMSVEMFLKQGNAVIFQNNFDVSNKKSIDRVIGLVFDKILK
jgi:hypothetical protein